MAGKVYVVQDNGTKNIGPATAFGEIVVLATRDLPLFHDPSRELARIKAKLASFDENDFILPVGDPLLIGSVIHYAAEVASGKVTCLKWDRQAKGGTYFPVLLNLKR